MRTDRWCECGCGRSIAFHRPQAKYYEAACRAKAQRARSHERIADRPVSLAGQPGYFDAADATRGYLDDWRPRHQTRLMLAHVQQILDEYEEYLPLTCRQIYYRMIGEWHYPKGKTFENSLYGLLDNARRAREIPFAAIRDDGIMGGGWWPTDPQQVISGWALEAQNYNRDAQDGQDGRVQVWCEAGGMIPQLARTADAYSVPVYSCGGFNSLTSIRQIVDSCVQDTDGPTVVLHLGDCDSSGYSIFRAVHEDVAAFLEEDRDHPEQQFDAERVAITFPQIEEFGLVADEITTNDSRSRAWRERGLTHKVEIEALAPDQIAGLLKTAIERRVDLDLVEATREQERPERDALRDVAELAARNASVLLTGERLGRRLASVLPPAGRNGDGARTGG
jgi:hypothetical protein